MFEGRGLEGGLVAPKVHEAAEAMWLAGVKVPGVSGAVVVIVPVKAKALEPAVAPLAELCGP